MRIIKFRAWDGEEKRFLPIIEGHEYTFRMDDDGLYTEYESTPQKNVTLQMFTGLTDKNGKEIYEGDIVVGVGKTKDNNWQIKRKPKVVEWVSSKNGTGFNIVASPEDYADKTCMRTEIIGNIYESPELLTKENK